MISLPKVVSEVSESIAKKKARETGRGCMLMLLRIIYFILSEMGTIESDLKQE